MTNVGAGRQRVYLRKRERARKASRIKSKMHLELAAAGDNRRTAVARTQKN